MNKVLIVDDAIVVRMTLKQMLVKNGFEVAGEAENGVKAIEQYQLLKPDIVTMDITMPEMDGITAIQKIIELDCNARIIVISSLGQVQDIRAAVAFGARSFIVKPFTEEMVLKTLRAVLGEI